MLKSLPLFPNLMPLQRHLILPYFVTLLAVNFLVLFASLKLFIL